MTTSEVGESCVGLCQAVSGALSSHGCWNPGGLSQAVLHKNDEEGIILPGLQLLACDLTQNGLPSGVGSIGRMSLWESPTDQIHLTLITSIK